MEVAGVEELLPDSTTMDTNDVAEETQRATQFLDSLITVSGDAHCLLESGLTENSAPSSGGIHDNCDPLVHETSSNKPGLSENSIECLEVLNPARKEDDSVNAEVHSLDGFNLGNLDCEEGEPLEKPLDGYLGTNGNQSAKMDFKSLDMSSELKSRNYTNGTPVGIPVFSFPEGDEQSWFPPGSHEFMPLTSTLEKDRHGTDFGSPTRFKPVVLGFDSTYDSGFGNEIITSSKKDLYFNRNNTATSSPEIFLQHSVSDQEKDFDVRSELHTPSPEIPSNIHGSFFPSSFVTPQKTDCHFQTEHSAANIGARAKTVQQQSLEIDDCSHFTKSKTTSERDLELVHVAEWAMSIQSPEAVTAPLSPAKAYQPPVNPGHSVCSQDQQNLKLSVPIQPQNHDQSSCNVDSLTTPSSKRTVFDAASPLLADGASTVLCKLQNDVMNHCASSVPTKVCAGSSVLLSLPSPIENAPMSLIGQPRVLPSNLAFLHSRATAAVYSLKEEIASSYKKESVDGNSSPGTPQLAVTKTETILCGEEGFTEPNARPDTKEEGSQVFSGSAQKASAAGQTLLIAVPDDKKSCVKDSDYHGLVLIPEAKLASSSSLSALYGMCHAVSQEKHNSQENSSPSDEKNKSTKRPAIDAENERRTNSTAPVEDHAITPPLQEPPLEQQVRIEEKLTDPKLSLDNSLIPASSGTAAIPGQEMCQATPRHQRYTSMAVGKAPRPNHYDISRVKIGSFTHVVKDDSDNMYFKLKILFSRKVIAYEWEVPGSGRVERQGNYQCIFAMVEIPMGTVVGVDSRDEWSLTLEVNMMPRTYQGYRTKGADGQYSPHQLASYNRDKLVDFTDMQLTLNPYHQVRLKQPKVIYVIQRLCNFDLRFSILLNAPFTMDPCKKLGPWPEEVTPGPLKSAAVNRESETLSANPGESRQEGPARTPSVATGETGGATVKKKNKKGQPPARCECTGGCLLSRCSCVRDLRLCTQNCFCLSYLKNCSNSINQLQKLGVELVKAWQDCCLMDNIFKVKDLHNYLKREVFFPCCNLRVKVIKVIPGTVKCLNGCDTSFKYSWCHHKLLEETKMPRNHCASCGCCGSPGIIRCQTCDKHPASERRSRPAQPSGDLFDSPAEANMCTRDEGDSLPSFNSEATVFPTMSVESDLLTYGRDAAQREITSKGDWTNPLENPNLHEAWNLNSHHLQCLLRSGANPRVNLAKQKRENPGVNSTTFHARNLLTSHIVDSGFGPALKSIACPAANSITAIPVTYRAVNSSNSLPAINPGTASGISSLTDPAMNSFMDPAMNSVTNTAMNSVTDPAMSSVTNPALNSVTNLAMNSVTDPAMNLITCYAVNPATDLAVNAMTGPSVNSVTGATVNSVFDQAADYIPYVNVPEMQNLAVYKAAENLHVNSDMVVDLLTNPDLDQVLDGNFAVHRSTDVTCAIDLDMGQRRSPTPEEARSDTGPIRTPKLTKAKVKRTSKDTMQTDNRSTKGKTLVQQQLEELHESSMLSRSRGKGAGGKVTVHLGSSSAPQMIKECNKLLRSSHDMSSNDLSFEEVEHGEMLPIAAAATAATEVLGMDLKKKLPATTGVKRLRSLQVDTPWEDSRGLGDSMKRTCLLPHDTCFGDSSWYHHGPVSRDGCFELNNKRKSKAHEEDEMMYCPPLQEQSDFLFTLAGPTEPACDIGAILGEPLSCSSPVSHL